MAGVFGRYRRFVIVCCIVAAAVCLLSVAGADDDAPEYPDVLVHDDTVIEAEQKVGRLMVSNGNAVVKGRVTEGILVADGNLFVAPGARVSGNVFVLGGDVTVGPGGRMEKAPVVIAPKGHLFVTVIVGSVLFLCAASLILVPAALWLAGRLLKKSGYYRPVRRLAGRLEDRWPWLYILLSFAVSALMLAAFAFMAWNTLFRDTLALLDREFVWLVRYFANSRLDRLMIFISDLGQGVYFAGMLAITYCLLIYRRQWWETGALSICMTGGAALVVLFKHLFQRPRPDLERVIAETGYSFPSGHAMVSLCFYGMAAFLLIRALKSWRQRMAVFTVALCLVVAIGISRIYLGVHYPTDVIAGYAAGFMWLFFCLSLLMWWEHKACRKQ